VSNRCHRQVLNAMALDESGPLEDCLRPDDYSGRRPLPRRSTVALEEVEKKRQTEIN